MKFRHRRILKLKKEYFPVENNYRDSKSICTNEIVKEANRLAAQYDITILEISESSWMIGGINIYTKATKQDYEKFCRELIDVLAPYLAGYTI